MTDGHHLSRLVRVDQLSNVQAEFDKINKKAEKCGLPALAWREVGPRTTQWLCVDETGGTWRDRQPGRAEGDGGTREVTTIEIDWPGYALALPGGWRMVAVVERGLVLEDGTTLNEVRGTSASGDLSAYRKVSLTCDHCKADRRRNSVIVVQDSQGNRRKVGTGCVADYLGHDVQKRIDALAALFRFEQAFVTCADDDAWLSPGGRGEWTVPAAALGLLATRWAVEEGYTSRKQARESVEPKVATADQILVWMGAPNPEPSREAMAEQLQSERVAAQWALTAADLSRLSERIRADDEKLDDFEYSAALIFTRGYATRAGVGTFVAFCVLAYLRRQRQAERAARAEELERRPSEYVGEPGKRVDLTVEVDRIRTYEGQYGLKVIVAMRVVGTNDSLVWFASGWRPVEGAGLAANAEPVRGAHEVQVFVKEHKSGKFGKETVVQRVTARKVAAAAVP